MISESQIEKTIIDILTHQENQWTYREDIKTEKALWDNLREHINRINIVVLDGILLKDSEFNQIKNEFKRLTTTPFMASQWLRGENGIAQISIEREDISKGTVTLTFFSNKDIASGISSYEVVNQIVPISEYTSRRNRGDVTLLINGLPLIHIEIKSEYARDGYLQAFNQIERYAQSGFFNGIFSTVHIFVVSNRVSTKYFARPSSNDKFVNSKKFLFSWREPNNTVIEDLYDFTRQVLSTSMVHELISRFTILVDDKKDQQFMMVLRAYQIHAIKKIMEQVIAHKGGFIWHATGSGKTITSFVATKLLAQTDVGVSRTVMIVDRKDLDSQTKDEFSKFASEYNIGQTSRFKEKGKKGGKIKKNSLIVGIDNRYELVNNFINKENNNTIIITTIQKLSRAIRDMASNKFDKVKGEHIVFIVDECHRAVSDVEMKSIKKIFPMSTWIGLTGTPIFDENQKQEKGTYARTTFDQYGELLHAYTTKNAIEDKSVLDFQVEYYSLMSEDEEKKIYLQKIKEKYQNDAPEIKFKLMVDDIEKEALLHSYDYENDIYIETMLKKIFRYQSILEKFKVINGMPTMSGILTTHSISQAKRIYYKLQELKSANALITGNPINERRKLNDLDFPRVAITYSLSESQEDMNDSLREMEEIMAAYNNQFGSNYSDVDLYNKNINKRLARKEVQYQKNGEWLDFVIVVDRLLTGFDAPTIQTLYVDRELKYQKLLQAFSRTNRACPGKNIGMIVTFRKPATMVKNVEDAIRLFSNEDREWEKLVPKQYSKVKENLEFAYNDFLQAKKALEDAPHDLKKELNVIKTFQAMRKIEESIKSYEEFEDDFTELSYIMNLVIDEVGHIENLKLEVKETLKEQDLPNEAFTNLFEIEFSADQRATHIDKIDSYYISRLLKDIQNSESKRKFEEILSSKPLVVKKTYDEALYLLKDLKDDSQRIAIISKYFKSVINDIITDTAEFLQAPKLDFQISFNEYKKEGNEEVPYINIITDKATISKEDFQDFFNKKYRERRRTIEAYWKQIIEEKLLPLKEELKNFSEERR